MSPAVQQVIDRILEDEGGIADVGDGKGVTRFGQTKSWLDDHGFVPPANAADAAANYAAWMDRMGLTWLCDQDAYVGWLVTDMAVHSGMTAAVKVLQRALSVPDDGVLGPRTRQRLEQVAKQPMLAKRLVAGRVGFLAGLVASEAVDRRKFARGWFARVARQIERLP